ncbi:MAG: DNA polymerase I [Candidatus Melainabacteria bacterium]|nr:DNA polymerase I [Candidatus Melainabacteria bacterium]
MAEKETIVLVDGSSLAFRMFYALFSMGLRSSTGIPTGALYGFFNAIFDLIEKYNPTMLAVAFDREEPTFRKEQFVEYKANRQEMPDDLAKQWPLIKEGVRMLGIPMYELAGFEADDVIGTVAKDAEQRGMRVDILTGDKDAFQLVSDIDGDVQVLMPPARGGGLVVYRRAEVFEKMGVWPEQIIDYKALCGDSSDNIPGVKGIGPKTAVDLLTQYKTLDGVYEHVEELKSKSVKAKLTEGREIAYKSQMLATIKVDVPLDFDFAHCRLDSLDASKAIEYFQNLGIKSIVNRLPKVIARISGGAGAAQSAEVSSLSVVSLEQAEQAVSVGAAVGAETPGMGSGGTRQLGLFDSQEPTSLPGSPGLPAFPKKHFEPPSPQIVTTEEELDKLIEELSVQQALSVDLETKGLESLDTNIVGYALAWGSGIDFKDGVFSLADKSESNGSGVKTAYIPVGHSGILTQKQLDPALVAQRLKPVLENPAIGKIAQNGKFEMNVLSLYGIKFGPVAFDTMIASYILNPDDKHGLKDQVSRVFNYEMVRIQELIGTGKKQVTMEMVQIDKAAPYAADDARMTLELARTYLPLLDKEQKYILNEIELPLSVVLAEMEQNGIALDIPYLKKFSIELSTDIARLESEIYALAGYSFNINSTQQLQKLLFEDLGLKSQGKTTKKTGLSTDAAAMEALKNEHVIIPKILEYRHLAKLRSTYVDSLIKLVSTRDNRLHGTFNQTVAATGRLSSTNPNLQNIPIRTEIGSRIRRAFIPEKPDWVIMSADYSQIELRMLAHMAEDPTLIDAFQKNQDIHQRTAKEIFDIPLEEVTKERRAIGKTMNFALVYQQGDYRTGIDLGVSTAEAKKFREKYFNTYPNVMKLVSETLETAREKNYVETIYGRRRYFRYLNDRNSMIRQADERAAFNAPLQGSAADLMKLAMIRLNKDLKENKLRTKIVLQVHDELVLEVPNDEVEQAKKVTTQAMEYGQPLKVPLVVDIGVGPNWMEAK